MASNKLFEAAAEILAGSKSAAPAMPPQHLDAEIVDLGGPKYNTYKSTDDSAKIDATKAAKSAKAPTTKPSAASSKMEETEVENEIIEEFESLDEVSKKLLRSYLKGSKAEAESQLRGDVSDKAASLGRTQQDKDDGRYEGNKLARRKLGTPGSIPAKVMAKEDIAEMHDDEAEDKAMMKKMKMKKKMKEDVDALFADDSTISEEFKSKVSTIFEARVEDRVAQIEEEIETHYAGILEEAVESIKEDLTTKVDDYLSYIVEQWMEENQIAIETGLRAEITEDFIAGLRNLFAEHYIDVPAEKVDLVEELAGKVEELESKLNEEIERGVSYAKALVESRKNEIIHEVTEGLIVTQVEKIKSLAESVEFSTADEYKEKLETIRENYFPSGVIKASEKQLQEEVTDGSEKAAVPTDPLVAAVAKAITKTNKF
jgi:hypothetical protein